MDLGALVRRLVAGPSGGGGATASSGSVQAFAPGSPGEPPARQAWRDAPPIQRAVGSAPLVAPNAVFEARLATARPAPLALAPLGHDRGLEAPASLVSGIAAPVRRSPSAPMPASVRTALGVRAGRPPAVQRSAEGIAWPDDVETAAVAVEAHPRTDGGVEPGEAPLGASSGSVRPVTAAPSPLLTAPSPVSGLVGLIGPAAVAAGPRAPSLPAAGAVGAAAVPSMPVADRPMRRIRVGAPLTPTVSRMAVPVSSTAASSSSAPTAAPSPGKGSLTAPAAAASSPLAPGGVSTAGADALATVARATAEAGAPGDPEPPAPPAGMTPPSPSPALARLQRSAEPTPSRGPLVGGLRPMLTPANSAISVLRRVATPETEIAGDAVGAGSSADALAALGRPDWAAADAGWAPGLQDAIANGSASPGGPGSPFAFEPGQGGVSPARLTWTSPMADASSGPGASALPGTAPATGPAMPTIPAGALAPAAASPASASSPTVSRSVVSRTAAPRAGLRVGPAMTGALAGATGRPASHVPVRPPAPAAAASGPGGQAWDPEPVVARAVTISEPEVAPESSAASVESGAAADSSAPPASGGGGRAGTAAGSAAGAAGSEAARDQETQAWADRLYDRISLRLRRDLLVERERSGALVDRGF